VHASNIERFDQAYEDIGRKVSLPGHDDPKVNNLELVSEWLSHKDSGPWLLVLDNADDEQTFYSGKLDDSSQDTERKVSRIRYLPQSLTGSILITTRNRDVGEDLASTAEPIEVLPMTAEEAKSMAQSKVPISKWNEVDWNELLQELEHQSNGYLPLAITQATSFIRKRRINFAEYLKLLRATEASVKDLLEKDLADPRRDPDTPHSVIRTWKLSFDRIRRQQPLAADVLSLMAVLDRQGIPKYLLRRDSDGEVDIFDALGTLQAFSMITAEKGEDIFEIHRLVQLSVQRWPVLAVARPKSPCGLFGLNSPPAHAWSREVASPPKISRRAIWATWAIC